MSTFYPFLFKRGRMSQIKFTARVVEVFVEKKEPIAMMGF